MIPKAAAPQRLWQIFRIPLAIALAGLAGMLSALLGDGACDAAGWIALGLPFIAALRAWRAAPMR